MIPLPSWNDGPAKQAIVDFVEAVTTEGGADFVPPAERIATFDNDGTLWVEQPDYIQLAFALDRIRRLAPEHPEWTTTQPFKAVLDNDLEALKASGEEGVVKLVMATHAGMTTEEFATIVGDWIAKARHPRFDRPYTELVYQPMLELLAYLRANGFKTFIVSGGGVEFMRPWTERVYGIPPEQVVGSQHQDRVRDPGRRARPGQAARDRLHRRQGRQAGRHPPAHRPPADRRVRQLRRRSADAAMDDRGQGPRLGLIVHHTDAEREYAYDRDSHVGRLDQALDAAGPAGWVVVSMKDDWIRIFPGTRQ